LEWQHISAIGELARRPVTTKENLISNKRQLVIPAHAGIQGGRSKTSWIPGQARNDEPKGAKKWRALESG
jgi:hypothetical protein